MSGDHAHVALATSGALTEEARYLHQCLFGRLPSPSLISTYLRAHTELPELNALDPKQVWTVQLVIAHRLDPLGVEYWLRSGQRRHALSAKLLLLGYLSECDACHPEFARRSTATNAALLRMTLTLLRAMFVLVRGRVQKARYGLL